MATPKKKPAPRNTPIPQRISLSQTLSKKTDLQRFKVWLVGTTPLIVNAWSEKAKREMLAKHVKATKPGKELREPEEEFRESLYSMGDDETYGFPVTAIKKGVVAVAHKDKGIPKTVIMSGLYLDAAMVSQRPALAGARCDMPLIRIYGSDPEMREDMVKIGTMTKTAAFAYRGQFTTWAMRVTGTFNVTVLTLETLSYLFDEAGRACGLGEWRNERFGPFGAFRPATAAEEEEWEAFAAGKGPLPYQEEMMAAE